jgi:hypothetical protein
MPCERIKPDRDWLTPVDVVNRGVNYAPNCLTTLQGFGDLRPAHAGWPDEANRSLSPESMAIYVPV